ncbi:hypothetical protein M427DRAFT_50839 [Gonapodya prolifera JEL478]|uniref:Uncharacterized protein n=1 Tax=Gonapodya prolifera (strain JEL478) TaxID=1344416 RepID=A0A139B0L2_GONPJ|nr:hypothetical protein M427DRAFT_50839 [Gonapodya prolifera JEL478]|eukprot:KXS22536.1 hypothetical protein M427DRAFT_50839 [Gonapodya prolifera JEL478]
MLEKLFTRYNALNCTGGELLDEMEKWEGLKAVMVTSRWTKRNSLNDVGNTDTNTGCCC